MSMYGSPVISNELIFDLYSALTHKRPMGVVGQPGNGLLAPTWVGTNHWRRLQAYKILWAYLNNVARLTLATQDQEAKREHREYGDPSMLVESAVDALLGDKQAILVDGAASYDPSLDGLRVVPDKPTDTGESNDDGLPELDEDVPGDGTITQEDHDENEKARRASEREEWLRDWEDDEGFAEKRVECENNTVGLGDGVYVLGWSSEERRVCVQVYDPGFYFPVLDETGGSNVPRKIHIAWDYEDLAEKKRYVHRITWQLGPINGQVDDSGEPRYFDGMPVPHEGDELSFDDEGVFTGITRRYPWQAAGDPPSRVTCYMSEATWELSNIEGRVVENFRPEDASWSVNEDGVAIRDLDLGIDFIPVIHVPNTPSSQAHFGKSLLLRVAQLLDDIQASDTDLNASSATTGTPMIALSNSAALTDLSVKPGAVFQLGPNGRATVLEATGAIASLLEYRQSQLERLSTNTQLPGEVIGRNRGSVTAPSGIALALTFGPLQRLVRRMRLTRERKYPLVYEVVQKLSMAAGEAAGGLPAGEVYRAELRFGSFLPSDRAALIDEVRQLLVAPAAISHQTALAMLVDGGIIDVDIADELNRLQAEAFMAAVQLLDATGDEQAVRDFLSLEGPPPPPQLLPPGMTIPGMTPPGGAPVVNEGNQGGGNNLVEGQQPKGQPPQQPSQKQHQPALQAKPPRQRPQK